LRFRTGWHPACRTNPNGPTAGKHKSIKQPKIAMKTLQDLSIKQVFSTLRENFTTTELEMIEHDVDQLLMSSETMEQLITLAKEALENKRITLTVAA